MFELIGAEEILENVIGLSHKYFQGPPSKAVLQKALRAFLTEVQPSVPKPIDLELCIRSTKNEIAPFLAVFRKESILDDFQEVFDDILIFEQQESIACMKQALCRIDQICPVFKNIIDIVIHTIFSAPSKHAGGGSTSAAIGCIWMDLRSHWQEQDILEFLVHETTHNLVFIDELSHGHYGSYQEVANQKNFAQSAILSKFRPLDKVFHSIVVSVEVLSFRQDYLGHPEAPCVHPPTAILLDQTKRSITSVFGNPSIERLLTNRSRSLLKKCMQKLETLESAQLCSL